MGKKGSKPTGQPSKVEIPTRSEFTKDKISPLVNTLQARFKKNMSRHDGLNWSAIEKKLKENEGKMWSLFTMEITGGEPDVIGYDKQNDEYLFVDCAKETPNRRSICYDRKGQDEREKKGIFPGGNAVDLAEEMGIELLNEEQYRDLQEIGEFDLKSSSWIKTPPKIRKLGGALFCDRRYDTVFTYHNGAQSFYSGRGFRGLLRI